MDSVGIDFGTTNSVMAIYKNGQPEVIQLSGSSSGLSADWEALGFGSVVPSLYALDKSNNPFLGWDAKSLAARGLSVKQFEAVKRMFLETGKIDLSSEFIPEEVATMIFAYMKEKAQQQNYNPTKAVVTVPANSKALPRYRTKIASGMAGIQVMALVNEPTAAAMAYANNMPFDQTIMVVDWGGGTLDITVLQAHDGIFMELASKGIARNGGIDFDRKIASGILEKMNKPQLSASEMSQFMYEVEKAKIKLSSGKLSNVGILVPGKDKASYDLSLEELNKWTKDLIVQVEGPIKQVLKDIKGTSASIDAVVMVGGTSNLPAARNFVQEMLPNKKLASDINPMTAIAEGAAIAAAILTGEAENKGFFVSTEHALGTYTLDLEATVEKGSPVRKFAAIIDRNHKLPAKESHTFSPIIEQATSSRIEVLEGEDGLLEGDEGIVEYVIPQDKATLYYDMESDFEDRSFTLTYEYDTDGLIFVSAVNAKTGETVLPRFSITTGINEDPKALVEISKRAKEKVKSVVETEESESFEEVGELANSVSLPDSIKAKIEVIEKQILQFISDMDGANIRNKITAMQTGIEAPDEAYLDSIISEYGYLL